MKKILSSFFLLAFAISMGATTLYLKPNSNWKQGNERYAVYYFKSSDNNQNGWSDFMSAAEVNYSCYEVDIPSGYDKIIFARINGAASEPNWGDKWDQTNDLSLPSTNNCLTITTQSGSNWNGSWSTYTPAKLVPHNCPDVMLQAFYYNSFEVDTAHPGTDQFGDTRWTTLQKQSGEIGAYFDLVWLPPSALGGGTGYHPKQYSNQDSDWGSRMELDKLISSLRNAGTKVIADIVINHFDGMSSWCDYAKQNFGSYGVFEPNVNWVCRDDEMNEAWTNYDSLANYCWGSAKGPNDDGTRYRDARDWAHNKDSVRLMFRAYLQWMKNVMHYDGWRYDYAHGFHGSHINDYNNASDAYISFIEDWDSDDHIINIINTASNNTMALDFQTSYAVKNIAGWNYSSCKGSGLLGRGLSKFAVTFVDNHDMFMRPDSEGEFGGRNNSMTPILKNRLLAANAYILAMPGVPCVFYPHWYKYKAEIKEMINARHCAGVHSESIVKDEYIGTNGEGYQCTVVGTKGWLILCLGNKTGQTFPTGWKKIAYGGTAGNKDSYEMWVNFNGDYAPGLIATSSCEFEDNINGIDVTAHTVGGSCGSNARIYYTTDGTTPTTSSPYVIGTLNLNFKSTTVLKLMATCGTAQTKVQTYTYTYMPPQVGGITIRFLKPEDDPDWEDEVYLYSWKSDTTETDTTFVNILGAFPGARIYKDADGWYSYQFDPAEDVINFNISNGTYAVRSSDQSTKRDRCYGWNGNMFEIANCDTTFTPAFELSVNPASGVFRTAEEGQEVTLIAVGKPNAMIYYTLDGTEPNTGSLSAMGKVTFTVHETTTVKAYAFVPSDGVNPSMETPVSTTTYVLKPFQQGEIYVNFFKPEDWAKVHIYAFTRKKVGRKMVDTPFLTWTKDGVQTTKWPGPEWTETAVSGIDPNGSYWYMFNNLQEPLVGKELYVIFNIGSSRVQTQDILVDGDMCYIWNETKWRAQEDPLCLGYITALEEADELPADLDPAQPMYNVLGMPVKADYKGIVIQNGHRYLLK